MSVQGIENPIAEFETHGYVLCRKFFSESEVSELQDEIAKAGGSLDQADYLNKDKMIFYSNVFLAHRGKVWGNRERRPT
jgi:hypothetical protein